MLCFIKLSIIWINIISFVILQRCRCSNLYRNDDFDFGAGDSDDEEPETLEGESDPENDELDAALMQEDPDDEDDFSIGEFNGSKFFFFFLDRKSIIRDALKCIYVHFHMK